MKTATLFGIAAMGLTTFGVAGAFATPTLRITTPSGTTTEAFANVSAYFGAGAYAALPGSFGGFSWGGIVEQIGSSQVTTNLTSVTTTNPGNNKITFAVSDSGISGIGIVSMQSSGGVTATGATSLQTADLNGSVYSTSSTLISTLIGSDDSGSLSMNSATNPVTPSSSVPFNSPGMNLTSSSITLTVTNSLALTLAPGSSLTGGLLTTNLDTTAVTTPEPATLGLFAVGGLALLAVGRRNRSRS